jgi:Tol biopolymer transport system component
MTPDGRYIAFESTATDLVPGDTNGMSDVFVRDRVAGTTQRVSVKSDGSEITSADVTGGGMPGVAATSPSISADGRYVLFSTSAQLVAADIDTGFDLYRFDRSTGALKLVSEAADGGGSNSLAPLAGSISANGQYVAFNSLSQTIDPNDLDPDGTGLQTQFPAGLWPDVFLRNMNGGAARVISNGVGALGGAGFTADISADGRYVAYQGIDIVTNPAEWEVMVYDRTARTNTLVGLTSSGQPALGTSPAISADGNVVAFTNADDGTGTLITPDTQIGSDGHSIHLYVRNRSAGTTTLVDVNVPGYFTSDREQLTGSASLSADGRYVAFGCWCERVASGPDAGMGHLGVFRGDLSTRTVIEVDANVDGLVTDQDAFLESEYQGITADGSQVLFGSAGDNLVPGDNNNHADIFVSTPH